MVGQILNKSAAHAHPSYFDRWVAAFSAYDTPRDFLTSLRYGSGHFSFFGNSYPCSFSTGSRYGERVKLMRIQAPYEPLHEPRRYGPNLQTHSCMLCQQVVQSMDATSHPHNVSNNLIEDLGNFVVLPDRYPNYPGAAFAIPKHHPDAKGTCTFRHRVVGHILNELLPVIDFCDRNDLIAVRNHVLDGMNFPEHDHFHLYPKDIPLFNFADQMIKEVLKAKPEGGLWEPSCTPFATLAVYHPKRGTLENSVLRIISRLEQSNIVFTLAYYKGCFFISPRLFDKPTGNSLQIGGGVPLHIINPNDQLSLQRIKKHVYLSGYFDWGRFI